MIVAQKETNIEIFNRLVASIKVSNITNLELAMLDRIRSNSQGMNKDILQEHAIVQGLERQI